LTVDQGDVQYYIVVLLDGIEYVRDAAAKDCAVWFVSTLLKTCISVLPNTITCKT